jgi:hypothetical protein
VAVAGARPKISLNHQEHQGQQEDKGKWVGFADWLWRNTAASLRDLLVCSARLVVNTSNQVRNALVNSYSISCIGWAAGFFIAELRI